MKNWLPLVSGPAFAMLKTPGPTCFTVEDNPELSAMLTKLPLMVKKLITEYIQCLVMRS